MVHAVRMARLTTTALSSLSSRDSADRVVGSTARREGKGGGKDAACAGSRCQSPPRRRPRCAFVGVADPYMRLVP